MDSYTIHEIAKDLRAGLRLLPSDESSIEVILKLHLEDYMKDKISIVWGLEDVMGRAEEIGKPLSEDQGREILELMDRRHDAGIGINWDVIDCHIDMLEEPSD